MAVGDNDALQLRLAQDASFLNRVQYWIVKKARDVVAEDTGTPSHAARRAFAAQVLGNPALYASAMAVGLATHINLTSVDTVYDPVGNTIQTTATGAEMFSAVGDLWNVYAGV